MKHSLIKKQASLLVVLLPTIVALSLFSVSLLFPTSSLAQETETLLAKPTEVNTPTSTNLRITEVMYNPLAPKDELRSDYEFIELQNVGTTVIDLTGLQFTSAIEYTFPHGSMLQAGDLVVLARSASHFAKRYGFAPFAEYTGKLNNAGEKLVVQDRNGNDLIVLTYGAEPPWPAEADACGFSLTLADSAANTWRRSAHIGGSPNQEDPDLPQELVPVLINEILAHTDLPQVDAVELYNPTQQTADLTGWRLVDKQSAGRFAELGTCPFVAPGGYLVFYEDDLGFALSALGQRLSLESPGFVESPPNNNTQDDRVGYRHELRFGASANGRSFGRYITSTGVEQFPPQQALTLGKANAGPLVGPIVISEIMYNPTPTENHAGDEYIELTNNSQEPAPLYDPEFPLNSWRLRGIDEFIFAADTEIPAQETMLVVAIAPALFRTRHNIPADVQIVGPYSGKLANSGDKLTLMRPDRQNTDGSVPYLLVEEVAYSDTAPWPTAPDGSGPALRRKSLVTYGNDVANWKSSNAEELSSIYLPSIQRP